MLKLWVMVSLLLIPIAAFSETQSWYFVRHFEKQTGPDPQLTAQGRDRAQALAAMLEKQDIQGIYSTNYKRTLATAQPLAELLNMSIRQYDPRLLEEFAEELQQQNHMLVVGHSNTTPELVNFMGGQAQPMQGSDYGTLYKVTADNGNMATTILWVK
jgi:broad specificity phosphatase PhoE